MTRVVLAVVLAFVCTSPGVLAQSASASLSVTANVVKNCTITTAPVNFGGYDPVQANASRPLDGTGTVTVACTKGAIANIALNEGANDQGGDRRLRGGSINAYLRYDLYKDGARSDRWEEGTGALHLGPAPNRNPRSFTVYGRVPAAQDATVGAYADSVVATVNF